MKIDKNSFFIKGEIDTLICHCQLSFDEVLINIDRELTLTKVIFYYISAVRTENFVRYLYEKTEQDN